MWIKNIITNQSQIFARKAIRLSIFRVLLGSSLEFLMCFGILCQPPQSDLKDQISDNTSTKPIALN